MNELFKIADPMIDRAEANMPRAVRFCGRSFRVFRVSQGHDGRKETPLNGRTSDLGIIEADTLVGALNEALARFGAGHREHLVIQESGERGIRLHVYAIKRRSAARYVYHNHVQRAVHDLYAAPVCTIDGGVIG